jgi:hypothetical protein
MKPMWEGRSQFFVAAFCDSVTLRGTGFFGCPPVKTTCLFFLNYYTTAWMNACPTQQERGRYPPTPLPADSPPPPAAPPQAVALSAAPPPQL